ncbi:hypothetical protein KY328_03995 [Candidatus Woesearchaeota archaeon]|nr:hypothetical protein [Candidatus Woesearchaeota archaeon]MBW3022059.1 hypothetical protein [Candidatus Woesearchaeota archaeon]
MPILKQPVDESWGIVAFVTSLLSFAMLDYGFMGLVMAIIAVVGGVMQIQKKQTALGKAGLILGIVSIVFILILFITGQLYLFY